MHLLKLFAVLATLTAATAAAAQADMGPDDDPETPPYNLRIELEPAEGGPDEGSGRVKFRQPIDADKIVYLSVRVRHLARDHSYQLQRAVDTTVDDSCTGTDWLTLGRGPDPQAITTNAKGNGRAELFRDLAAVPTGTQLDIHFRLIDAVTSAVVLESDCYQFTVRQ